jgi:hypothetical protein
MPVAIIDDTLFVHCDACGREFDETRPMQNDFGVDVIRHANLCAHAERKGWTYNPGDSGKAKAAVYLCPACGSDPKR